MIVDTLQNIGRYRGLHPNLDTAIRWLADHDITALPNGRTGVDGDRVFIHVMDADLQIDLTGGEHWGWADDAAPEGDFAPEKDFGLLTGSEQAGGVLGGERFVLFLPGEPHKPSSIQDNCTHLRKAVVKIEMG